MIKVLSASHPSLVSRPQDCLDSKFKAEMLKQVQHDFVSHPELVSGSQDSLDSKSNNEMLKQVQHDYIIILLISNS